ncbi:MAG: hypothetical protein ACOCRO_03920, partial [Halanaerobiales bacterium]
EEETSEPTLKPMIRYDFDTEEAYFAATPRVEVIERTATNVAFKIPNGIDEVTISVKEDGEIVETLYKVVLR